VRWTGYKRPRRSHQNRRTVPAVGQASLDPYLKPRTYPLRMKNIGTAKWPASANGRRKAASGNTPKTKAEACRSTTQSAAIPRIDVRDAISTPPALWDLTPRSKTARSDMLFDSAMMVRERSSGHCRLLGATALNISCPLARSEQSRSRLDFAAGLSEITGLRSTRNVDFESVTTTTPPSDGGIVLYNYDRVYDLKNRSRNNINRDMMRFRTKSATANGKPLNA
jgi:hypothetical protein